MKNYVKEEDTDLDEDEVEAKKDLVKTKMSIFVSIGYHMYNPWILPRTCLMQWIACTKMTLRTPLKDVKMQMLENIQCYFTKISHLKEQLESIWDNVKGAEA